MAFDLEVFNRQLYTTRTETYDQAVNRFNENSGGTIVLSPSSANVGDFSMEASFRLISGLVSRRDVKNGSTAVNSQRLTHLKNIAVKIAAKAGPVAYEPAQYQWLKQNSALAALVIGEQLGAGMLKDQLNSAIAALAGAIGNNTALVKNITTESAAADKLPSLQALAKTSALFGDRSNSITAWIMHSAVFHNLQLNAIDNKNELFRFENVNIVRDTTGRIFVVTDSPALMATTGTGNEAVTTYKTLGLVQGAALVETNDDFESLIQQQTGFENIQATFQAEWSFNLGLFGYAWDVANGGSAPNDTTLGTGANWVKTATSNKDTAGVMLVSA